MHAPKIETERLVLRGHRIDDYEPSIKVWTDPQVVKHIGGRIFTRAECWTRMLRYPGLWAYLGYGYWVVEEKSSGKFVGEVGFADYKREIVPSIENVPEMGWVLNPDFHQKGYATEASLAALKWMNEKQKGRIVCIIDPANVASFRVAEKLGFKKVCDTTYLESPIVLLEKI